MNQAPKKILIVSRSFYPEISPRSFRTTELVKELCRQGHDVTLCTVKNDEQHLPLAKEFGFKIKDLGKMRFRNLTINSTNKIAVLFNRIMIRLMLMLFEYPAIELLFKVKKALKKERGYDLLISIAVPHPVHWGVAWAHSKKDPVAAVWVADCGDAFMGVIKHDSFDKLFYFKYFEKWFCRKADYIAIPNIKMQENYYPEFRDKIIEISQGFKFEDVQATPGEVHNAVPTFGFAGMFMRTTRNPGPFLDYLVQAKKDFKFIVYTNTPDLLLPYKEQLGDKLEIRGYIPRKDLIQKLSEMDFLLNIGFDPAQQAPSKLIDYYLTGRPILSLKTNEPVPELIEAFFKGDYTNKFRYDNMERFRIENVCRQFIQLCK